MSTHTLRFGIMEMQLGMLIPPDLPAPQVLARVASFNHADLTRQVAASGFDTLELGGDLILFFPQAYSPASVAALAELQQQRGLAYTVHLPLWSVEPSTPLEPVREGSARAVAQVIQATRPLRPEVYVLHATGALAAEFYRMRLPETARALILRQFQAAARQSIRSILAETGIPSRQLAIETIEFPFDLMLELAEELDVSICLDTGHVLAGFSGPIGLAEALQRCLPRLAEIHLHDAPWQGREHNLGYGKDHQRLGAGDLDTAHLLDTLSAAHFAGPLIFELSVPEALASLEVVRSLRPAVINPLIEPK
jgi:sugar phosphate isomerase/epimerase